jgi:hypothetical protein
MGEHLAPAELRGLVQAGGAVRATNRALTGGVGRPQGAPSRADSRCQPAVRGLSAPAATVTP